MKSLLKSKKQSALIVAITGQSAIVSVRGKLDQSSEDSQTNNRRLTFTENWKTGSPEVLAQELKGALAALGIRGSAVTIGIPLNWAYFTQIDAPELSDEDMQLYVETQVEREFPLSPNELNIAFNTYTKSDGTRRACVAGIANSLIERLTTIFSLAKLKPTRITLSGLSAHHTGSDAVGAPSLALWPNGERLEILTQSGGGLIAPRSLSNLWNESSDPTIDSATLIREIRITLGALREEIAQPIKEIRFFPGSIEWSPEFRSEFGTQLERIGLRPHWESNEPDLSWIDSTESFEFLPPEPDKWSKVSGQLKYLKSSRGLTIAAVIVMALIALFIWQGYRLGSLEKKWAAMESNVEDLEILQNRIRDFRSWFSSNPEHLEAFLEITKAFPETGSVYLQQLSIKNQREGLCNGVTSDQESLYATIEKLENSPGIRDVQLEQLRGREQLQFSFKFEWVGMKGQ